MRGRFGAGSWIFLRQSGIWEDEEEKETFGAGKEMGPFLVSTFQAQAGMGVPGEWQGEAGLAAPSGQGWAILRSAIGTGV